MSARDMMAAMLDELMGPKRNIELGEDTKVSFDDPNICPYYLVGFCPHDMFTNTKADLGACQLVHDDNLRRMYPEAEEYGQLGFERRLLRFLIQLDEDNLRRIRKNKDKLAGMDDTGGKRKLEEEKRHVQRAITAMEEEHKNLLAAAEQAGTEGDISKCQEIMTNSESIESEKRGLEERLAKLNETVLPDVPPTLEELTVKPMEVCEVCGSMLIINDAQQRVEEHLTGKMHTGFQKIRTMIQHLKGKLKEFDEAEEMKRVERRNFRESREKRTESKSDTRETRDKESSSRNKDRRHRSRSPHRSSRDERSSRDSRDSRDSHSRRDQDRNRDRDQDRNRDRDHRHHDRGYDRDRRREHSHRDRHH